MKVFIRFCSRIKYLGLLGFPSFFMDYKLFDFLWSFWLFGLIEIFYNFPVFVQSVKQLAGMLIILIHYGRELPDAETYRCKVQYSLPFRGNWTVVNGSIEKEFSHSWNLPPQRYAYDFIILNEEGRSYTGNKSDVGSYHCYGQEILAPADGEVVECRTGSKDSFMSTDGQIDCSAKDIRGNYIIIRHAKEEYSLLAHLKPDSVIVRKGDNVKRGQIIALCGNTGNSSEPHLHFQLQKGANFYTSPGLPIEFKEIEITSPAIYPNYDTRPVPASTDPKSTYIARGQNVMNKVSVL